MGESGGFWLIWNKLNARIDFLSTPNQIGFFQEGFGHEETSLFFSNQRGAGPNSSAR
jgi:hypothetical protein